MSNSIVPKFTVVIEIASAQETAMCGKAYDPRLIVAWPSAKMAVMGGAQAAKVLLQIKYQPRKERRDRVRGSRAKTLTRNSGQI